jgi:hypothetical protein
MQPIPIPEIYVLWHPQCPLGEKIARRILAWLRPGNGLGPEVFYRSLPAPEAPIAGLPPPLPGEPRAVAGTESVKGRQRVSNLHIVLPLIDENMVADIAWRHWLEQLTLTRASIPSTPNQIIINWLPDPTTLLHIPSVREGGERDILYPGRGLSGLELDILSELFPCLTFRSFEEVLS